MSRSYKKNPVSKDSNNKWGKKISNKKLRKKVKDAIYHEIDEIPKLKEVFNSYNFLDYKDTDFKNKNSKLKRK